MFAGTDSGLFISTDDGQTWTASNSGLTNLKIRSFGMSGGHVYTGTRGGGVFVSSDNGLTWSSAGSGLPGCTSVSVRSIIVSGANLVAGVYDKGVYLSTDGGATWSAANTGLTNKAVWCLVPKGKNIFAGTDGGAFLSTNNGASWTAINSGLSTYIRSLAVTGSDIFAGSVGVWRRSLSEVVSVHPISGGGLPDRVALEQNYPNPFNPSTRIRYALPKESNVVLKVCDVLGRDVKMLVEEKQASGEHEVDLDATTFPSGVYFYRLEAGGYFETKRFVVLK
jgi:hypothetical protein